MANFFSNANGIVINGGTFSAIQGHAYIGGSTAGRQGMRWLLNHVTAGAFHDAAERGDPPRCHPDTRKAVLAVIMSWIKTDKKSQKNLILWLNGPAGAGKTAIAQTIAEICAEQRLLAASFFFSRSSPTRNSSLYLICSIAYQLSLSIPNVQENLLATIERDPTIFDRSLASQASALILEPLDITAMELDHGSLSAFPNLILVDGLDECQDENIQEEILTVLSNAIIKSRLPLLLLVASRPEFAIRESFSLPEISRITQNLGLYEDYEAEKDVETFLRSSFSKIKARHPAVRHLVDWPPESSIKYFIDMSSRQFIYAATVVKYVQSPRHNPALRMNILRGLSKIPSNDMPFSQLDLLYTFILDSIDNWPRVSEILALLILDKHHTMTSDFVDIIFGYETGDIYVALTDMHALVHLPEQDSQNEYLHLHHASMRDFLIDPLRSGRFHINPPKGYAHLSKCCIRSMMRLFGQGKPSDSLYAIMTEFIQFFPKSYLTPELFNALESFILPAASILPIYALPWQELFDVLKQSDASRAATYPRILYQFDQWILQQMSQYPPKVQACIPAAYNVHTVAKHWTYSFINDVFSALLYELNDNSVHERIVSMDENLLGFNHRGSFDVLSPFFTDPARAGDLFPTATSFSNFARTLANIIQKFHSTNKDDVIDRIAREFYKILSHLPRDRELAIFLRDCMGPFNPTAPYSRGKWAMSIHVLQYLQECNVPSLTLPRHEFSDSYVDCFGEQFR